MATIVRFCLDQRLDGIDVDWEHPKNAAEEEAYGKLLADLNSAFDPHGLLLSVTVAAGQKLPSAAVFAVDGVQPMAYDREKRHSTFEESRNDVRVLIDSRVPPERIILGLPFYGRDVENREAITYAEIAAKFDPAPSADQIGNIYFNGPDTIRHKTEFAIQSRVGGVMIWELGQDAAGDRSLLKVVRETVDNKTSE